jgi:hypothetical protein
VVSAEAVAGELTAAVGELAAGDGVTIGCTAMGEGDAVTFEVRTMPQPAMASAPTRQLTVTNVRRTAGWREVTDTGLAVPHRLGTDPLAL